MTGQTPDFLCGCFDTAATPLSDDAYTDRLSDRTAVPSAVIRACATYALPEPEDYGFSPHSSGNDTWMMEVRRKDLYQDYYYIDWRDRLVLPGSVTSTVRGRNFGRQLFANRALTGLVLGFAELTLEAAGLMGGFTWPRTGALPDKASLPRLKTGLRARADLLHPWLNRREWERLDRWLMLREKTDLWHIAAMDRALDIPRALFDETRENLPEKILSKYEEKAFFYEGAITPAQFLLAGLHYDAYVRFDDADQMDRLETRCHTPVRALAHSIHTGMAARGITPPTQCAKYSSIPPYQTARPR